MFHKRNPMKYFSGNAFARLPLYKVVAGGTAAVLTASIGLGAFAASFVPGTEPEPTPTPTPTPTLTPTPSPSASPSTPPATPVPTPTPSDSSSSDNGNGGTGG